MIKCTRLFLIFATGEPENEAMIKPFRYYGSKWISHKRNDMKRVLSPMNLGNSASVPAAHMICRGRETVLVPSLRLQCSRVGQRIKSRLTWFDLQLMCDIIFILNTSGWEKAVDDGDEVEAIDCLIERFAIHPGRCSMNTEKSIVNSRKYLLAPLRTSSSWS